MTDSLEPFNSIDSWTELKDGSSLFLRVFSSTLFKRPAVRRAAQTRLHCHVRPAWETNIQRRTAYTATLDISVSTSQQICSSFPTHSFLVEHPKPLTLNKTLNPYTLNPY
jgi:hypothetical protein